MRQHGVWVIAFCFLTLATTGSVAYGHEEAKCDAILGPQVQCGEASYQPTQS